jgi:hypothetical protein
MKRGDVAVQRGMHAWRNPSKESDAVCPARVRAVEVGGKALGEDYGTMAGVRASSLKKLKDGEKQQ